MSATLPDWAGGIPHLEANATNMDSTTTTFRPLLPEPIDQGDPYVAVVPRDVDAQFRYYVYTTGEEASDGLQFPVYGSNDLTTWAPLGRSLRTNHAGAQWAPCVCYREGLPRPYVMLYSRAVGVGEEGHIGHALRRADARDPEGPFIDSGHVLTPDLDFAIDPDVYRSADGSLKIAFATDFVGDLPFGTGIVECGIHDDLTGLSGELRVLARPQFDWQLYDSARAMPWKSIEGVDWSRQTVRWSTIEAPVGGLVSPKGDPVYLYSGGCFFGFYAVGALIEDERGVQDVTNGERNFVVRPDPGSGFFAPGHCSRARLEDGREFLMLHARFGALDAKRQMCLARLRWTDDGLPFATPVGGDEGRERRD